METQEACLPANPSLGASRPLVCTPLKLRANTVVPKLVAIAAACLAVDIACADIGFVAAVSTCRQLVPNRTMTAIRQRQRNNVWVYEGDLVNNPPTEVTTATINRDTGATIDIATVAIPPVEVAATAQTLQRLHYATVDYAQALATANAFAAQTNTERMLLLYEAGVLSFRVSYFTGGTIVPVDSITGGVVPAFVPGLGIEPTVSAAEMAGAIAHAQWRAGSNWTAIEAWANERVDGTTVRVLLANRITGELMNPEVVQGFYISAPAFAPMGSQVARAAAVAAGSSPVVCPAIAALTDVQSRAPLLGVNRLSLEVRTINNSTSYTWVTGFVGADGIERDARANAAAPCNASAVAIVAPVDLVAGDLNRDGLVDARDLAELLASWGAINPLLDLDEGGSVDAADLAILLSNWR